MPITVVDKYESWRGMAALILVNFQLDEQNSYLFIYIYYIY